MLKSVRNSELSQWIERYGDRLRAFLCARVECAETAADLTQDTYLRLHAFSQRAPAQNIHALTYRIAAHLVVDHYRKQAIRAQEILSSELSCPLADPPPGPEEIQLQRERAESIEASLFELSECCRRAFLLHAREGLSYAQIASRLGVSKSMVAKHLARAVLHCKRRLGE